MILVMQAGKSSVKPITKALLPHRTDDVFWTGACEKVQLSPSRVICPVSSDEHSRLKKIESAFPRCLCRWVIFADVDACQDSCVSTFTAIRCDRFASLCRYFLCTQPAVPCMRAFLFVAIESSGMLETLKSERIDDKTIATCTLCRTTRLHACRIASTVGASSRFWSRHIAL